MSSQNSAIRFLREISFEQDLFTFQSDSFHDFCVEICIRGPFNF